MNVRATLAVCAAAGLLAGPALAESLYSEERFRALTSDHRAHRVGDALTVLVVENASASASADTSTEKRGSAGLSLSTTRRDEAAAATATEDFSGGGRIQRSGRLLAQLTVSVRGIAPNGDLLVGGAQVIEVNEEKQNIVLEGRVRPVDVSEANTVLSSRIAEARITYVGDGLLGEKQKPGLISRVLSWLGLL
jgi:flagellar L-ring protein precursor FlgH